MSGCIKLFGCPKYFIFPCYFFLLFYQFTSLRWDFDFFYLEWWSKFFKHGKLISFHFLSALEFQILHRKNTIMYTFLLYKESENLNISRFILDLYAKVCVFNKKAYWIIVHIQNMKNAQFFTVNNLVIITKLKILI